MKKCKPITKASGLVGGQTYILVCLVRDMLSISYETMCGQPFSSKFDNGGGPVFLKYRNCDGKYKYSSKRSLKDANIPAVRKHYNENRLFRFTANNDRLLKEIVARCDVSAYRALISFA